MASRSPRLRRIESHFPEWFGFLLHRKSRSMYASGQPILNLVSGLSKIVCT